MTKLINLLLVLALMAGIGILMYPTVCDQYNQFRNAKSMTAYTRRVHSMNTAEYDEVLASAVRYNESLKGIVLKDAFAEAAEGASPEYLAELDPNGDGIMGVIEIPKIRVRLPIYHTTEPFGLERGLGHMEGTSLPVGGESTHCGLAGHSALPTARLLTDLDQMEPGDLFYITVLDDTLVYQVDQILTVLPHELDYVSVEEGRDLVTLVTCTPYGVNTHRLLVRGTRVRPADISAELAATDSVRPVPLWENAALLAGPVILAGWLLLWVATPAPKPRKGSPAASRGGTGTREAEEDSPDGDGREDDRRRRKKRRKEH